METSEDESDGQMRRERWKGKEQEMTGTKEEQ